MKTSSVLLLVCKLAHISRRVIPASIRAGIRTVWLPIAPSVVAASRFRLLQKLLSLWPNNVRSAFYVGEKFSTYEEFADKLTIDVVTKNKANK